VTGPEAPLDALEEGTVLARRVREVPLGRQRRLVAAAIGRTVVASGLLVVAYALIPFDRGTPPQIAIVVAVTILLLLLNSLLALRSIAKSEFPILQAVEALTVSLILLLIAFGGTYLILSNSDAAAFDETLNHMGALYFTLTTLTTIGYGDIAPVSDAARLTVMTQMVIDVLIIGVFIKLVVNTVRSRLASTS
jgi:voltage-gated potassium channel